MRWLNRIAPPLALFFLAPLVAEYLLGDLNLRQLPALVAMAPLCGGGAVLIREAVRRTGRSWPSFLLLALAYALTEEGLLTQSLFNPDYLHLRLLDYGFVPMLGTSPAWAIYVLGIHIIWSLAVPIGLAEALFPARRTEPWLSRLGLILFFLLLAAGMAMTARFSLAATPFRASPAQLAFCVAAIAALIAGAFVLPRPAMARETLRGPVSPPLLGFLCLVAGSAFLCVYADGRPVLPWWLTAGADAAIAAALCAGFAVATRRHGWGAMQGLAAACGGLLCYAWFGYGIDRDLHGPGNAAGHSVFVVLLLAVAIWAGFRTARAKAAQA
ncbi:MAG TPA: hypothetical protein VFW19_02655 [Allosphingosinicella sp.]|nr:hypothetical protein [Allosphingosinicella sp.]